MQVLSFVSAVAALSLVAAPVTVLAQSQTPPVAAEQKPLFLKAQYGPRFGCRAHNALGYYFDAAGYSGAQACNTALVICYNNTPPGVACNVTYTWYN